MMHNRRQKFLLSNLCIFFSRNVLLFSKTLSSFSAETLLRPAYTLHRLATDCQRFCLILSLISLSIVLCWTLYRFCTDSTDSAFFSLSAETLHRLSRSCQSAQTLHIFPETVKYSAWFSIWFLSLLFFAELCTDSAQTPQTLRDSAADSAYLTWLCTDFATNSHSFAQLTRIRLSCRRGLHELRNNFEKLKLYIRFSMSSVAVLWSSLKLSEALILSISLIHSSFFY